MLSFLFRTDLNKCFMLFKGLSSYKIFWCIITTIIIINSQFCNWCTARYTYGLLWSIYMLAEGSSLCGRLPYFTHHHTHSLSVRNFPLILWYQRKATICNPLQPLVAVAARLPLPTSYWLVNSASLLCSKPISMLVFPTASHFTLKMQAARSSETLVSYHNITQHHILEDFDMNVNWSWPSGLSQELSHYEIHNLG
jgi:hypothetical protein